jgi:hypothetical protein
LVAVTHGAQLRDYGAAFRRWTSAAANRCEKAAVLRFVGEYEVLLALLEVEGAVTIFAASENINLGCIFSCESFADSKMEANDCRGCGRVRIGRNIFGCGNCADERHIVLL